MLFQVVPTIDLSIEADYLSLLLSIDAKGHPLLRDLPFKRESDHEDFSISSAEFDHQRQNIISGKGSEARVCLSNIRPALLDKVEGYLAHPNPAEINRVKITAMGTTAIVGMLSAMQDEYSVCFSPRWVQNLSHQTSQSVCTEKYHNEQNAQFCREVLAAVQAHALVYADGRVNSAMKWAKMLNVC